MSEKKTLMALIIIVIILVLGMAYFAAAEKNERISINVDKVASVSITEWQGRTEVLEEKDEINPILNYLNSLKLKYTSWYFGTPKKWDYRVGIYNSLEDGSSEIIESFYITKDGKIYKNNFEYEIVGFYYKNFIKVFPENEN